MTRLPWEVGPVEAWRLDDLRHAVGWDSGRGAELAGGRWNPVGYPVVYASADPATAILEVAVHKGFGTLDLVPHMLTEAIIDDPSAIHVVRAADVPNANWLTPAPPSRGQQNFGKSLLEAHRFVLIPSSVSVHSWNLLFNPVRASGKYRVASQELFFLDTRLNPP